jgi:hypothetical protein
MLHCDTRKYIRQQPVERGLAESGPVVVTGGTRHFGNVLMAIGVVR